MWDKDIWDKCKYEFKDIVTIENCYVGMEVFHLNSGPGIIQRIHTDSVSVRFNDLSYYGNRMFLPEDQLFCRNLISNESNPKSILYNNINGFKVFDISFTPEQYELCYIPSFSEYNFFKKYKFSNCYHDKLLIEAGMVYPYTIIGGFTAIDHAKALLYAGEKYE